MAVIVTIVASLAAAGSATAAGPTGGADAPVHPGVMTHTDGGQCTANFVFSDASDVYIGQAAHCAGTGGQTETNGCDAGSLPVGTPVEVDGASRPGTLAYSSWLTMQAKGEQDPDTCQYNDFALVKLDPADHASTNASIPFWGGPTGMNTDGAPAGSTVLSYGNSSLRGGTAALSPKEGVSVGTEAGGWNHPVYTVTPGIPGDSGSAFLDGEGRALGTLSTLAIAPLAGSNGVGDIRSALGYLNAQTPLDVTLEQGTAPFRGPLAPAG